MPSTLQFGWILSLYNNLCSKIAKFVGSNPTRVISMWFCWQSLGKYWVSVLTHIRVYMGKTKMNIITSLLEKSRTWIPIISRVFIKLCLTESTTLAEPPLTSLSLRHLSSVTCQTSLLKEDWRYSVSTSCSVCSVLLLVGSGGLLWVVSWGLHWVVRWVSLPKTLATRVVGRLLINKMRSTGCHYLGRLKGS